MKYRSALRFVLLTVSPGWIFGCAESEQQVPPVLNAIDQQQAMLEAAAEEERMQAARAVPRAQGTSADAEDLRSTLPDADIPQHGQFEVTFDTTAGSFTMQVHREWAPIGAHRFYQLVRSGFYDECGFFRVVPGFMVQFGLAADPAVNAEWKTEITDDPVTESNLRGYVTFAKTGRPNSRTTQVFINFGDNSRLDGMGFAPFGKVTQGMDVVDSISAAHGEQPQQPSIENQGNTYLKSTFPQLDYIHSATLTVDDLAIESVEPATTSENGEAAARDETSAAADAVPADAPSPQSP